MSDVRESFFERVNHARYRAGQLAGHYESFFQRANDPERARAFWIRYTMFSPDGRPQDALGELWAISFDGETGERVAVKTEVPFAQCVFRTSEFFVKVGSARLGPGRLVGIAAARGHAIEWDLRFHGDARPLLLLPLELYDSELLRAKALVGLPMALYHGSLTVDGRTIDVADWVGSQNHNWGTQHTDHYAWGQVAGFDTALESFLEMVTARIRLGSEWSPFVTSLVLRHAGREFALSGFDPGVRHTGTFEYFRWRFSSESDAVRIEGTISAPREAFVALTYHNPAGGTKHCLNSKIAACELRLTRKQDSGSPQAEELSTKHRAAFEILTDERDHGVELRV